MITYLGFKVYFLESTNNVIFYTGKGPAVTIRVYNNTKVACRFLFLLLYISVWNSGVCYVGQCGEKWQVFQVNRVAPCTKSLSSRSIYPSFQNESTFTFNFHFKIPHILDISIMIDFELNLFLMSLLI